MSEAPRFSTEPAISYGSTPEQPAADSQLIHSVQGDKDLLPVSAQMGLIQCYIHGWPTGAEVPDPVELRFTLRDRGAKARVEDIDVRVSDRERGSVVMLAESEGSLGKPLRKEQIERLLSQVWFSAPCFAKDEPPAHVSPGSIPKRITHFTESGHPDVALLRDDKWLKPGGTSTTPEFDSSTFTRADAIERKEFMRLCMRSLLAPLQLAPVGGERKGELSVTARRSTKAPRTDPPDYSRLDLSRGETRGPENAPVTIELSVAARGSTKTRRTVPPHYSRLDLSRGETRGPENAPVTIIAFLTVSCRPCTEMLPILDEVLHRYGKEVRLVTKVVPLLEGEVLAAEALLAAQDQGRIGEMMDLIFANAHDLSRDRLVEYARQVGMDAARFQLALTNHTFADQVREEMDAARSAGVSGRPTFFIGGEQVNGMRTESEFLEAVAKALRSANAIATGHALR
jgi:protein-disulfide isomerase